MKTDKYGFCKFVLSVLIIIAICYFTGIGCPVKFFTGVSCMGCGMSRAVFSAVRLDFVSAFYYHPLFIILPLVPLFWLFKQKLPKFVQILLIWTFILLFVGVYIIRIIYGYEGIVDINIQNGFIYKVYEFLFNFL